MPSDLAQLTLVAGTAATWAMVGVIWTVQRVQYPALAEHIVHEPGRAAQRHQQRISWVVGPLMAVEGITALVLLVDRPSSMDAWMAWAAAILLAVALGSTAFVQVPLHARLAAGDDTAAAPLISTNWVRTAAWTGRGVLLSVALLG